MAIPSPSCRMDRSAASTRSSSTHWKKNRRARHRMMDPTTKDGLLEILDVAVNAAREAAALVHAGWRSRPLAKGKKTIIDLVTEYDRESERLVRDRLTKSTPFHVV